ncbi:hypothetical protein VP01_5904g1, partial [Puccinia sorghi]
VSKNPQFQKLPNIQNSLQWHLTPTDQACRQSLEERGFYNSCFGTGKAPAVGCTAKDQPNPRQMKDQFNTYKDKYKKVHTRSISMGFGLTNEDQKAGISKINDKLESIQAFIKPWFKVDAQADKKIASSTSEPAGSEIRSSDGKQQY